MDKKWMVVLSLSLFIVSNDTRAQIAAGIKNFREYPAALGKILNLDIGLYPLKDFIERVETRLPKYGRISEINAPTMMAFAATAGAFCSEFLKNGKSKTVTSPLNLVRYPIYQLSVLSSRFLQKQLIHSFSDLFLDRPASTQELEILLPAADEFKYSQSKNYIIFLCTSFATSIEFLFI